jgi:TonB family protein
MKTSLTIALMFFGLSMSPVRADVVQCARPHVVALTTYKVEAEYPESALQQGEGGKVTVKVTLSPTGAIIATTIYKSSGFLALDKSALKAARASRYIPEVENCQRVGGTYLSIYDYTAPRGTRFPIAGVDTSTSVLPPGSNEPVGIHVSDLSPVFRDRFGFPPEWTSGGVGIDAVLRGSPAYRSGLLAGDVIMDLDGTVYRSADSLNDYLSGKKHGDVIRFSVWLHGAQSPFYTLTL